MRYVSNIIVVFLSLSGEYPVFHRDLDVLGKDK